MQAARAAFAANAAQNLHHSTALMACSLWLSKHTLQTLVLVGAQSYTCYYYHCTKAQYVPNQCSVVTSAAAASIGVKSSEPPACAAACSGWNTASCCCCCCSTAAAACCRWKAGSPGCGVCMPLWGDTGTTGKPAMRICMLPGAELRRSDATSCSRKHALQCGTPCARLYTAAVSDGHIREGCNRMHFGTYS
jgi:hypothetical protein